MKRLAASRDIGQESSRIRFSLNHCTAGISVGERQRPQHFRNSEKNPTARYKDKHLVYYKWFGLDNINQYVASMNAWIDAARTG